MAASTNTIKILAPNCMKISKIKIKRNQQVSKGTIVCLFSSGSDVIQKYKSTETGIVSDILVNEGEEVETGSVIFEVEGCSHPTVMKDMCADCGADLRIENSTAGNRKEDVTASVAMVHSIPELIVSEKLAKELGKADEENLLKTRKLVLLVDLDQTLIHTTNDNIPPNLKDVHHYQLWHGNQLLWYHTRLRPQTEQFLEHISKLYELHICTFGSRIYAHTIARILDPEGKYFSHRILSRDECFNAQSKTANLKALFPCGDAMVCIIDDREDVWHFSPNLVHVKPYRFFQGTADINAPPGLTKTEQDCEPMIHRVRTVSQSSTGSKEEKTNEETPTEAENRADNNGDHSKIAVQENKENSDKSEEIKMDDKTDKNDTGDQVVENKMDTSVDPDHIKGNETSATNEAEKINKGDKNNVEGIDGEPKQDDNAESDKENDGDIVMKVHRDKSEQSNAVQSDKEVKDENDEGTTKVNKDDVELIEWDDEDDYLFYLEEILKTIHSTFYNFYDQLKEKEISESEKEDKPSLRNLIPYIKKKVLRGCNILFSGVIPTNMNPEKSRAYIVAKALGANIHTELKTKDNETDPKNFTTHLVAAKSGTSKVRAVMKHKHIKKVNPDWLWSCSERWEKVEEILFPLPASSDDDSGRDSPDLVKVQNSKTASKRKRLGDNEKEPDVQQTKKMKKVNSSNDLETEAADVDMDENNENQCQTDKTEVVERREEAGGSGDKPDSFSMSYNPMLAFSDDDLAYMDKEVDDEMDDDEDQSSEEEEIRDCRIRKQVLKSVDGLGDSSSEDSLSGNTPRGWGLKKKMSPKSSSDDEMKGSSSPDHELGPEYESETDQDKFDKIMEAFGPETENSDEEYAESIGSVDEEIADAVMKEFLS